MAGSDYQPFFKKIITMSEQTKNTRRNFLTLGWSSFHEKARDNDDEMVKVLTQEGTLLVIPKRDLEKQCIKTKVSNQDIINWSKK